MQRTALGPDMHCCCHLQHPQIWLSVSGMGFPTGVANIGKCATRLVQSNCIHMGPPLRSICRQQH